MISPEKVVGKGGGVLGVVILLKYHSPLANFKSCMVPRSPFLSIDTYWMASILPKTRISRPVPREVTTAQTVTLPPPCFTFLLVNMGSNASPSLLRHQNLPSEPKRLNLLSSEKATSAQLSSVHSSMPSDHPNRYSMPPGGMYGTLRRILPCNPKLLSCLLMVRIEIWG